MPINAGRNLYVCRVQHGHGQGVKDSQVRAIFFASRLIEKLARNSNECVVLQQLWRAMQKKVGKRVALQTRQRQFVERDWSKGGKNALITIEKSAPVGDREPSVLSIFQSSKDLSFEILGPLMRYPNAGTNCD